MPKPDKLDITYEREAAIFRAKSSTLNAHITLAHDNLKNIREVFIAIGDVGADVNAIFTALGMIISISLRHDPSLFNDLVKTLCKVQMDQRFIIHTNMDSEPIVGNSLPQVLGLLMKRRQEYLKQDKPIEPGLEPIVTYGAAFDLCPDCQKLTLKRDGSCRKCTNYGYSSC
jgi:hypothetical protein